MKKRSLLLLLLISCCFGLSHAQTVLLSESFNVTTLTSTPPSGWTVSSGGTTTGCVTTDWHQVPSGGFVCTNNGAPQPAASSNSGNGMAGYNSWDIDAGSWSDLITPSLNFSALGSYTVDFYVFEEQTYYAIDSLYVLLNTTPSSTGATVLGAYEPVYIGTNSYGWEHYTINIPTTFTGTSNYIIFRGVSGWGHDIFIDDVTVTHLPPTPCSGTPQSPSITNAVMTTPICSSGSVTLNAVDPNLPLTSGITYQWETASSASGPWSPVSGGSGSTSLSYTTPTLTSSAWYRMALTCAASTTTINTAAYLVQVGAPQPSTITGRQTFCPGDTEKYSVVLAPATTYNWTLPTGWAGSSTTDTIEAIPVGSPGAVTITVTATDACGTSIPRTLVVSPGSAPTPPAGVSGNSLFCANTTQVYSVPPVNGALFYSWSLPSGWAGISTTNSITATNTVNSGVISVRAGNGCGMSLATTLSVNSLTALDPIGTIYGKDTTCSGALTSYFIHPVPGASSYIWTLPSGWSGTTTDTLVQVFPGSTGSISVTAYVSCATTAPKSKTVTVTPSVVPAVSISGPGGTLCAGRLDTFRATFSGGGNAPAFQWYKNGNAISATGSSYITNSLVAGDQLQLTMTSSDVCANPVLATSNILIPNIVPGVTPGVNINSNASVAVCTGTLLQFVSNITGGGTAPDYQWIKNGTDIQGAVGMTYSANDLQDGDTISLRMTSHAVCAPVDGTISNKIILAIRDTLVPQVAVAVSPDNVIESAEEVTFTATPTNGGTTPAYQWFRNGVAISYETNPTYTTSSLRPGDRITVRMFSYLDCAYPRAVMSNEVAMQGADLSVGTHEKGSFALYPNPTRGSLHIAGDLGRTQGIRADIMNAIGQVVYRVEFPGATGTAWETTISLPASLPNGQYLLQLRSTQKDHAPVNFVRQFQLIR